MISAMWNTGNWYSQDGQRIRVAVHTVGENSWVVFRDIDRMISGYIPLSMTLSNVTKEDLRHIVHSNYVNGYNYKGLYGNLPGFEGSEAQKFINTKVD